MLQPFTSKPDMALVTGSLGGPMSHNDLLAEATNSIVLPMTAEGVHTMTYNPNPTTSIVGKYQEATA